jgi:eukaryotic-like serine/threonine-protein kinase
MNTLEFPTTTKTLSQRLGEGRIPVQDGLRYAALLAEALRKVHGDGRVHGSVTPDAIALTAEGLDLLPAVPGIVRVTAYTAPEVAADHKPADARSDIFSFGAVVFEMLTGRRAFEGETDSDIAESVCGAPAPPSGSPAVDRLLAGCLGKDPATRWQRIQKVQLELKLLSAAARRSSVVPAAPKASTVSDAAFREEMARFEARVDAKLQAHEQAGLASLRSADEAVNSLRGQLSALGAQLSAAQEQVGRSADVGPAIEAAGELIAAHAQRGIDSLSERIAFLEQNPATPAEPLAAQVETGLENLREQLSELHNHVASDMHEFELNLKAQSNAIDSARTAMAQTDDLVERVVEALESLQSTVLEQSEDRVLALN